MTSNWYWQPSEQPASGTACCIVVYAAGLLLVLWWRLPYSGREVPAALIAAVLQCYLQRSVPSFPSPPLLLYVSLLEWNKPVYLTLLLLSAQVSWHVLISCIPPLSLASFHHLVLLSQEKSIPLAAERTQNLGWVCCPCRVCSAVVSFQKQFIMPAARGQARLLYGVLPWHPTRHSIYGSVLFKSLICKA